MNDTSQAHRQAWDLIPWIVNGSAPESEQLLAREHLTACADCRQELEFQRQLLAAMELPDGAELEDMHASWQRLRERLGNAAQPPNGAGVRHRMRGVDRGWMPWLVAALVVQAIGLGAIGAAWWSRPPAGVTPAAAAAGAYRTLAASEPIAPAATIPAATIRVVFAPEVTLAQMQAVLTAARLQVRAGPSAIGIWTLGPTGDSNPAATEWALRELRAHSSVRFAEAVAGAP